jgi:hypothetical protein
MLCSDGAFQVGQVFVDGGLQDCVGGDEVAVREVVAHAGDLPPRDRRLGGEQVIGDAEIFVSSVVRQVRRERERRFAASARDTFPGLPGNNQ